MNLHCTLDLECSNLIFPQNTPAYDAVLSNQVWLQTDQQFRRYNNTEILIKHKPLAYTRARHAVQKKNKGKKKNKKSRAAQQAYPWTAHQHTQPTSHIHTHHTASQMMSFTEKGGGSTDLVSRGRI